MTSVISTYDRNMINADYNDMLSFGAPRQTKLAFNEVLLGCIIYMITKTSIKFETVLFFLMDST